MTASTADTAGVVAAYAQGREDERRDLLLWLDTVVQFGLHRAGDLHGAALVQALCLRADSREHLAGGA
jgi:hypothetical protein